jgi:2-amino-4-hydroxy-6-hydroxymethyldihydropteridine diphosphokinase
MMQGPTGVVCFIGVGANLGRPADQCLEAVERMRATEGVSVLRRSSLYRTEPVGPRKQDWFVNAGVEIRTVLSARELMQALLAIEETMGRRREAPWGPRVIDLDLLLYGQEVIREPGLIVPHPAFHTRRFVLVPLHEIAPYVLHPAFGVSIRGLLDRLVDDSRVELTAV